MDKFAEFREEQNTEIFEDRFFRVQVEPSAEYSYGQTFSVRGESPSWTLEVEANSNCGLDLFAHNLLAIQCCMTSCYT